MAEGSGYPTIYQKIHGQTYLISRLSPNIHCGNYDVSDVHIYGALQSSLHLACQGTGLAHFLSLSSVSVQAPKEQVAKGFLIDFLMGGVSAAVSKAAAAPTERVKLRIQNQDEMIKTGRLRVPYKGIADCFARTIKEEGILSLWRGNTANVIRYFPTQGLNFAFKDYFKSSSTSRKTKMDTGSGWLVTWHLVVLLVLHLFYLSILWTMLEHVWPNDAKAATNGGERQFNGLVDVYRKTLESDGIRGLYRGFNISCTGIIVYHGLYFGLYDSLKPVVLVGDLQDSFLASFLLGWGITITAGLASYPLTQYEEG